MSPFVDFVSVRNRYPYLAFGYNYTVGETKEEHQMAEYWKR